MDYRDRLKMTNPQDIFAREYIYLARCMVDNYGEDGERALREAIRRFAVDRGRSLREAHLKAGLKINLYNLFTYGDLSTDPRMRRNKIKLTPQERLSETLVCALYDQWRLMDAVALGRIYCEEVHHAKFGAYAPKSQTNLTQTLTQGDDYCRFSVYLRPANMDDEEKAISFEEYGQPEPKPVTYSVPSYRHGFAMLAVRLVHAFVLTAERRFGEEGVKRLCDTLSGFADDVVRFLKDKANLVGVEFDGQYVVENCPIPGRDDSVWQGMEEIQNSRTAEILEDYFLSRVNSAVHTK